MSLAQILSTYGTLNLLSLIAFLVVAIFTWTASRAKRGISARSELKLHYFLMASVFGLTLLHPLLPKNDFFTPGAKIWSAESIKTFSKDYTSPERGGYLLVSAGNSRRAVEADTISLILLIVFILVMMVASYRIFKDLRALQRIRSHSFPIKKFRHTTVYLNDNIQVPFSYWLPFQASVILPTELAGKSPDFQMAICHELQHHRQGDTKWIFAMWALRVLCVFNPFIHLWSRWLSEVQEFACDETLVDQNKVESQQYARCLIEVAETALHQKRIPACATGLTFLVERNLLKRRIQRMINNTKTRMARSTSLVLGALVLSLMAGVAYASKGLVQDRRVSLADAKLMATKIDQASGFPIVVNDLVLAELNRYVGTPEGRQFMRDSLQRMENFRPLVEAKLQEYGVPYDLIAIPIVESGYQNLPPNSKLGWGAGLWMFIEQSARRWGMRVEKGIDERLNIPLETDAAMRYLKSNALLFKDWQLSVLAYNVGESKVERFINKTGSRDAFTLIREGIENDKSYLARVMAAILIMNNPESIE